MITINADFGQGDRRPVSTLQRTVQVIQNLSDSADPVAVQQVQDKLTDSNVVGYLFH